MTGCVGGDEGITSLLQVQKDEGKKWTHGNALSAMNLLRTFS